MTTTNQQADSKSLPTSQKATTPTELIQGRPQIRDTEQLNRLAYNLSQSELCPKEFKGKPKEAFVAILAGAEVGFPPMQSLKSIAVINGRPCIWGDGLPAVAQASGQIAMFEEEFRGKPFADDFTHVIRIERVGIRGVRTFEFSVADARRAGLWDERKTITSKYKGEIPNPSPWFCYPKRMLCMRNRAFAFRDCFADYLGGLHVAEEQADIITSEVVSQSIPPDREISFEDEPEIVDAEYQPAETEPAPFERLKSELSTCTCEAHLAEFTAMGVKPAHLSEAINDDEYDELHRLMDEMRKGFA